MSTLSTPDQFLPALERGGDCRSLYRADLSVEDLGAEEAILITGISRIVHLVLDMTPILNDDYRPGAELPRPVVFDHPVEPDGISLATVNRALWASYILCLDATEKAGKNPRAHTGRPSLTPSAQTVIDRLGIAVTPWDCVYGSDGAYWDSTEARFDPDTGTLTLHMFIGS